MLAMVIVHCCRADASLPLACLLCAVSFQPLTRPPSYPAALGLRGRTEGGWWQARGLGLQPLPFHALGANILARLCWECEAGGLWGQQAPVNHLHVRTGMRSVTGTPLLMSPEVISGEGYGRKADGGECAGDWDPSPVWGCAVPA